MLAGEVVRQAGHGLATQLGVALGEVAGRRVASATAFSPGGSSMPSKIDQNAALTSASACSGTLATTFRQRWMLCRGLHNVHYADVVIMPTWGEKSLWHKGSELGRSA
jgi:hypothetical protein